MSVSVNKEPKLTTKRWNIHYLNLVGERFFVHRAATLQSGIGEKISDQLQAIFARSNMQHIRGSFVGVGEAQHYGIPALDKCIYTGQLGFGPLAGLFLVTPIEISELSLTEPEASNLWELHQARAREPMA